MSCHNCKDRKIGCRSACAFWQKHEQLKKARYAERQEEFEYQQALSLAVDRMRKRRPKA